MIQNSPKVTQMFLPFFCRTIYHSYITSAASVPRNLQQLNKLTNTNGLMLTSFYAPLTFYERPRPLVPSFSVCAIRLCEIASHHKRPPLRFIQQ